MKPVILVFPSDPQNITLARSTAATLAARCDLSIDRVEDVRLAVDEAVSQLVTDSTQTITCTFTVDSQGLHIVISSDAGDLAVPDPNGFGWTVMRALTDEASSHHDETGTSIALWVYRQEPVQA